MNRLYIVSSINTIGGTILNASIQSFVIVRETAHNYVIGVRSGTLLIQKGRLNKDVFLDKNVMLDRLQKIKDDELESAKRTVEALLKEINIPIHDVPYHHPLDAAELPPIKL